MSDLSVTIFPECDKSAIYLTLVIHINVCQISVVTIFPECDKNVSKVTPLIHIPGRLKTIWIHFIIYWSLVSVLVHSVCAYQIRKTYKQGSNLGHVRSYLSPFFQNVTKKPVNWPLWYIYQEGWKRFAFISSFIGP